MAAQPQARSGAPDGPRRAALSAHQPFARRRDNGATASEGLASVAPEISDPSGSYCLRKYVSKIVSKDPPVAQLKYGHSRVSIETRATQFWDFCAAT